jgi:hypothetical protein
MEIAVASFLPPLVLLAVSRGKWFDDAFRSAVLRWFIPLTVVWYAPFWLTGGTPAPIDFLFWKVTPWSAIAPRDFGPGNNLLSDATMQFLPWRELVVDAWRHGQFPLLNRFAGSGSPLWANPQAAVLFPLTLLGIPFSTFAWPLFAMVSKTLIALAGMFLFLRSEELSERAAIFGSIAFAFSTYQFAFGLFPHTNVTILLPWLLLAIRRSSVTGAAIAVALMLLGGHPESLLHVALLAVPYGVRDALRRERQAAAIGRLAVAAAIGALLAAPVVLPFLKILPWSERAAMLARNPHAIDSPAANGPNVAALVVPALFWSTRVSVPIDNFNEVATGYAGLAALGLFGWAALSDAKRQRFWLILFAICLALAFRSPLTAMLKPVPVIGVADQGRVRFLMVFIIAVVAAGALDRATRLGPLLRWMPMLAFLDLAALGVFYHSPSGRELFYPRTPALDFIAARSGPFRVAGMRSSILPNTGAITGGENIGVHDPMSFEPYCALLERAGYDRHEYFGSWHYFPPKPLLDFLGVRYIVTPPGAKPGGLPIVYSGRDAVVFENAAALPRFFVPDAATTATSPAQATTVGLELYGRNGAALRTRGVRETLIASSEVALPGWTLTCDDRPWPLVPIHGVFLGWQAPAGDHRFALRYRPEGWTAGWLSAAIGLILLVVTRIWAGVRAPE